MPWGRILLSILLLLGLTLMLRFGVRLTSRAGQDKPGPSGGRHIGAAPAPGREASPEGGEKEKREKERDRPARRAKGRWQKRGALRLLAAANDAGFVLETLRKGLSVTREKLLRRIVVNRLTVHIAATAQDPMKTTLQYGALSASVWGARRHSAILCAFAAGTSSWCGLRCRLVHGGAGHSGLAAAVAGLLPQLRAMPHCGVRCGASWRAGRPNRRGRRPPPRRAAQSRRAPAQA